MKKTILIVRIAVVTMLAAFDVNAQDLNTYAIAPVKDIEDINVTPSIDPVHVAEVFKTQPSFLKIKVSAANQSLSVNYKLPADAYKSELRIQDTNGRLIKTFALNSKRAATEDFYVSDLLGGNYKYTLLVNGQKVEKGSFELKD